MSPFSIFYSDFKQVKYGLYFADFLPIRVPTIITNDGTKYRFSVKKAKAFINEMKLKKANSYSLF